MRRIFYILLSVTLFTACVNTEFSPWEDEVIPVVFSIISPENQVQVFLGQSGELSLNSNQLVYPEARIYLRDINGNNTELTRKNDISNVFVDINNEIAVCEGCTYNLTVQLTDLTLNAETTVPDNKGELLSAKCLIPSVDSTQNAQSYSQYATLIVSMKLLHPDDLGYFLAAFGKPLNRGILFSSNYLDQYYYVPDEITSFKISLMTTDPVYRAFLVSGNVSLFSVTSDIASILTAFGGVRPVYSNIENGVGMFGSFVTDTMTVNLTQN